MRRLVALCCLALVVSHAVAADQLINIAGARTTGPISYWWMPREGAEATLLLISGGAGGMGFDGVEPRSDNFLVRTRELFAAQHFNVAVLGLASDMRNLTQNARASLEHAQDVLAVVKAIEQGSKQPLWLVGTSLGTVSASSAAILDQGQTVAGVVLSSGFHPAFLKLRSGPRGTEGVAAIKVPVLVYHHKLDGCRATPAYSVSDIVSDLTAAPVKKLMLVEGGGPPSGDPCEPRGFHGFVGMEARAVEDISGWIKRPVP